MRVRAAIAPLLAEPRISSEQISQRLHGSKITVVESRGDWRRVQGDDGYEGWTHVGYLDDEDPEPIAVQMLDGRVVRDGARTGEAIAATARAWVGTPYVWGGVSPWGADCSGFVQTTFALHGVSLPRDAWQQGMIGDETEGREPGELVFFSERDDGRITHVGIIVAAATMAHVALGRGGHAIDRLDAGDPYVKKLVKCRRFARRVV
jgi:cell wall-associated NlpC family hydrolase